MLKILYLTLLLSLTVQASEETIYKLNTLGMKCSAFSIESQKLLTASHCFKNLLNSINKKVASYTENYDKLNFITNSQKVNLPIQILDNKNKVIFDSIHNKNHKASFEMFIIPEMIPTFFPKLMQKDITPNYNLLVFPHISDALVLKIEGIELKKIPKYSTDKIEKDETLTALGYALGEDFDTKVGKVFSPKIIEEALTHFFPNKDKDTIFNSDTKNLLSDFLVVSDNEIIVGMSGGAMLNSKDQVVALLSATKTKEIQLHNFSFGIKIDKVLNFFPKKFKEYKESLSK